MTQLELFLNESDSHTEPQVIDIVIYNSKNWYNVKACET